jgi:aquaporin Z
MKKYLVEGISTFFLVLTIGLTVVETPDGVIPPLAIGFILMVMIYAGGHVSGAHYNPAVTLAVYLRGRCPASDVAPYVLSQLAGAAIAAGLVLWLKGNPQLPAPPAPDLPRIFVAEFLFTFALAWVILNVATSKNTVNNFFYGLAIGLTVTAGAFAVGTISGAAFNPAVVLGAAIMGLLPGSAIWVYILANLAGGAVAAYLFRYLHPEDI